MGYCVTYLSYKNKVLILSLWPFSCQQSVLMYSAHIRPIFFSFIAMHFTFKDESPFENQCISNDTRNKLTHNQVSCSARAALTRVSFSQSHQSWPPEKNSAISVTHLGKKRKQLWLNNISYMYDATCSIKLKYEEMQPTLFGLQLLLFMCSSCLHCQISTISEK